MVLDGAGFFSFLDVFWVNLVLSGDNAILIALACGNLPERQRRIGMVLGATAAIGLRLLFSGVAIPALSLPGLKIAGALLLILIASGLMADRNPSAPKSVEAHNRLWKAVGTIALADIVLSLDNVLVIVGIAHDRPAFLVLGLAMSIPLIVWGAGAISRIIQQFPALIAIGAGIIGWSAGELAYSDPLAPTEVTAFFGENGTTWSALLGLMLALTSGYARRFSDIKRRDPSENF
jgi:YjbE family integral membrane protein